MLTQNQDNPELPAAERRVKKEEFAHAIAALEARRQAEAQQQEGTVVIGDVLEQLQINVPAEEVLQEIQALHTGESREKTPKRSHWTAERIANTKLVSGIILVPLAAIALGALLFHPARQLGTTAYNLPYSNYEPPWLMLPTHFSAPISPAEVDEGGFNASSVLKPLSAVPNEQIVRCNTGSLTRLATSCSLRYPGHTPKTVQTALSTQQFDVRPGLQKPWRLIKHDGRVYLRAWTVARFTPEQVQQHHISLFSTPDPTDIDAGVKLVPITLPLGFYGMPSFSPNANSEPAFYNVIDVQLDNHAWEKWQP